MKILDVIQNFLLLILTFGISFIGAGFILNCIVIVVTSIMELPHNDVLIIWMILSAVIASVIVRVIYSGIPKIHKTKHDVKED